ncbi:MAG: LamG-like jellyroll fold domain-containing protein [Verrucomicrobiota bacterium]
MSAKFSNNRVDQLAERLRDDALGNSDAEELREVIRHHPAARRRLVEQLYLSAELKEGISRLNLAGKPEIDRKHGPQLVGGLLLAAAAAIALWIWSPWTGPVEQAIPEDVAVVVDPTEMDSQGIAVISQFSQVVWGEGTTLPEERLMHGEPVGDGVIDLVEGLVQIDFYSGATVVIEGPALFHLKNPQLSHLEHGSLWAHVPPAARGFRVDSRVFEVIDHGTEFGIKVTPDGDGEVHVMDGEVEVRKTDGPVGSEHRLKTGEGIHYDKVGSTKRIQTRPTEFPAAGKLSQDARKRFREWSEYQRRLVQDPDVVVAYTFPRSASWQRELKNQASAAPAMSEGAIVGCKWTKGRWPGKGALAFDNSSHRVRLNLPGTFRDLTLACWVRIDRIDSKVVSLLHPDTRQERHVHWTLVNAGEQSWQLNFADSGPNESGQKDRRYYFSEKNVRLLTEPGEWVHLAVVYDSEARELRHYVNGEEIKVAPIEEPRELAIGFSDIGNWPYEEWAKGTEWEVRNLNGAIDEFLIVQDAWDSAKIREVWSAGRP